MIPQNATVDPHNTPHDFSIYELDSEHSRRGIDLNGIEDIIISEKLSCAIRREREFAQVGSETDSNRLVFFFSAESTDFRAKSAEIRSN